MFGKLNDETIIKLLIKQKDRPANFYRALPLEKTNYKKRNMHLLNTLYQKCFRWLAICLTGINFK